MTGRLPVSKERLATTLIHKTGHNVEVHRPDGTATENKYNKVSDTDKSLAFIETTIALRLRKRVENVPDERGAQGGRVNVDTPWIAVPNKANVQSDDHIVFPDGREYELNQKLDQKTHREYESTLVNP